MHNRIAAAYIEACLEELAAPKPGNVHLFASGHGMTADDFRLSAEVSAEPLCRTGARLGERVLGAISTTRAEVNQNTNLGIILLCAPLAAAAELGGSLRSSLDAVLRRLTPADAVKVFEAIALAAPGGLGEAERYDVRKSAPASLLGAMQAASDRDRIARAYVTGFADIFDAGLAVLEHQRSHRSEDWWPATAVYLAFLSRFPDTHIVRKYGAGAAEAVRLEAESLAAGDVSLDRLLAFDASLKARNLNPGTSADFTVATLFAARLDRLLREGAENG